MKPSCAKAKYPGFRNLVAKQIREHRKGYGWTQAHLRRLLRDYRIKLNRSAIVRIERGDRCLFDYELVAMAAVFQVQIADLIPNPLPTGFRPRDD